MNFVFCAWRIRRDSAEDRAWRRIGSVFELSGANISYGLAGHTLRELAGSKWANIRKADSVFCATIWQVFVCYLICVGARNNIVYWVQGLVAEESYLKKGSRVRYGILLCFERLAFRLSSSYIFVSGFMERFYIKRYGYVSGRRRLVIPCVSDLKSKPDSLRRKNSFCYLGGMSSWQRFDLVVEIMNKVAENCSNSTFWIATRDTDMCKDILRNIASPKLLSVTTVTSLSGNAEVAEFLSQQEFGFLIRDDNSVNNVSSPIKLAEYLSCGVNVITTEAVRSYVDSVRSAGYVIQAEEFLASSSCAQFEYKGEAAAFEVHRSCFSQSSVIATVRNFLN